MNRRLATLGLLLILLAFPPNSLAQTIRHENWEHNIKGVFGALSESNGTLSTSSTVAHSGTYSLKTDITVANGSAGGYWQNSGSIEMSDYYARIWAYIPTASYDDMDVNGEYWSIMTGMDVSGSIANFDLRFYNVGGTEAIFLFYDNYGSNDSVALSGLQDTWICLEVHIVNGTDKVEWWVNGDLINTFTTADIVDQNTGLMVLGSLTSSGVTGAIYTDDFVWDATRYIGTGWRVQEGNAVGSHYQY